MCALRPGFRIIPARASKEILSAGIEGELSDWQQAKGFKLTGPFMINSARRFNLEFDS